MMSAHPRALIGPEVLLSEAPGPISAKSCAREAAAAQIDHARGSIRRVIPNWALVAGGRIDVSWFVRVLCIPAVSLGLVAMPGPAPITLVGGSSEIDAPGSLTALDARTGERLYRRTFGRSSGARLSLVHADGRLVYVQRTRCLSDDREYRAGDTRLLALDAATGKRRWEVRDAFVPNSDDTFDARWAGFSPGPIPIQDRRSGQLRVLDPRSGEVLWSRARPHLQLLTATTDLLITMTSRMPGPEPPPFQLEITAWSA